jgi:hypothetical protein
MGRHPSQDEKHKQQGWWLGGWMSLLPLVEIVDDLSIPSIKALLCTHMHTKPNPFLVKAID